MEDDFTGRGTFTWADGRVFTGTFAAKQPVAGELKEAGGARFAVAYAADCTAIWENPTPTSKVLVAPGPAAHQVPFLLVPWPRMQRGGLQLQPGTHPKPAECVRRIQNAAKCEIFQSPLSHKSSRICLVHVPYQRTRLMFGSGTRICLGLSSDRRRVGGARMCNVHALGRKSKCCDKNFSGHSLSPPSICSQACVISVCSDRLTL